MMGQIKENKAKQRKEESKAQAVIKLNNFCCFY